MCHELAEYRDVDETLKLKRASGTTLVTSYSHGNERMFLPALCKVQSPRQRRVSLALASVRTAKRDRRSRFDFAGTSLRKRCCRPYCPRPELTCTHDWRLKAIAHRRQFRATRPSKRQAGGIVSRRSLDCRLTHLAKSLGVTEDDNTALGTLQDDIQTPRVVQENDILISVAWNSEEDDVVEQFVRWFEDSR
jgi:hypothetical protein